MTPERRAKQFLNVFSDIAGPQVIALGAAELARSIRSAENDALERAAGVAEGWATGRFAAQYIRALKHAEPAALPTDEGGQ